MSSDPLLVAVGAVPGAWLRYRVANHLEPMVPRKHWGTFGVNLIACFALGLLVGVGASCGGAVDRTLLLLGTGFLGSFSTFSTLAAELHHTLRQGHTGETLLLATGSVLAGGAALAAGLWIAA